MNAQELITKLGLKPLPWEGGYYHETYRTPHSTAIYYLITPDTFSALHRVPQDEIFHFYLGQPAEMLLIHPSGKSETLTLGSGIFAGEHPQFVVPGGCWQGLRLKLGTQGFALLGTTVSPPFEFTGLEVPSHAELVGMYPHLASAIEHYTVG